MNKKGLTLVELIATLTILGIILSIAVPKIAGLLNSNTESVYLKFTNLVYQACESYSDIEMGKTASANITINNLFEYNYLTSYPDSFSDEEKNKLNDILIYIDNINGTISTSNSTIEFKINYIENNTICDAIKNKCS